MKKIIQGLCGLGLFLPMIAQAYFHRNWLENAVLGISVGEANRKGSLQTQLQYGGVPIIPAYVISDYSDSGLILGALAGYQATCFRWLMGVEFNLDWQPIDKEHAYAFSDTLGIIGWNMTARYKRDLMAGLSARIGYAQVNYFMPYARIGVEVGRDHLEATFSPNLFPVNFEIESKQWVYRFLIGLGAEIPIPCMPLSARMEFDVHSKGKTVEVDGVINTGLINPLFQSRMQPQTVSARLALVWNFF